MFCTQCHYNLQGCLTKCPECGQPFDARDSRTFEPVNPKLKRLQDDALTLLAIAIIGLPIGYGVMRFLQYQSSNVILVQTPQGPVMRENLADPHAWIAATGGLISVMALVGAISCFIMALREKRINGMPRSLPARESGIVPDESP